MLSMMREGLLAMPGLRMLKRFMRLAFWAVFLAGEVRAFPQRIASGTVGTDEILLKLLKGEESRIIAVSRLADDPRYSFVTEIPKTVKARVGDNIESLLLLRPDLVFIASYTAARISDPLKAAKVNVHVQRSFTSFADIKANIKDVGLKVGKAKEAEGLVKEMELKVSESLRKQKSCPRKPRFLQYVASDFLPGRGTIIDDLGEIAGYHNVLRDVNWESWSPISQELLVQQKPDVIIASAADAPTKEALLEKLRSSPVWTKLDAVKNGRIILVPDRLLYTVSHHVADLLIFLIENRSCPELRK